MRECTLCKSKKINKIPLISEISRYTKKSYSLCKCCNCGLVRPCPLPYSNESKNKIYDDVNNIKFFNKKLNDIDYSSKEYKYYFKYFKPYLELCKKYKIKGKSLDVGCGNGHLLSLLSSIGFDAEGTEISPTLVKVLKKRYKVFCCDLNDKILKNKKYNLITFNQVLEHVENFQDFMKNANALLKSRGYIIFSVPYLYGIVPQILRSRWYGLGYGQHLNFFSKKSIKILLEKNGFELCEFKLLVCDYAHPKFPKLINVFANFFMSLIRFLNLGDNLFVVARKIK